LRARARQSRDQYILKDAFWSVFSLFGAGNLFSVAIPHTNAFPPLAGGFLMKLGIVRAGILKKFLMKLKLFAETF